MTREIKFRAWDKKNKKWLDDADFLITADGLVLLYDREHGREVKGLTGAWREDEEGNVEIVRFTGLHDKNGVEIYSGYLLGWDNRRGEQCLVEVAYSPAAAAFVLVDGPWWKRGSTTGNHTADHLSSWHKVHNFEVIGNIYENPELLTT